MNPRPRDSTKMALCHFGNVEVKNWTINYIGSNFGPIRGSWVSPGSDSIHHQIWWNKTKKFEKWVLWLGNQIIKVDLIKSGVLYQLASTLTQLKARWGLWLWWSLKGQTSKAACMDSFMRKCTHIWTSNIHTTPGQTPSAVSSIDHP